MSNQNKSKMPLYLIIGLLVVGVAVLGYFALDKDEPDLSIEIGDQKIEVDTK
jgi:hypothetical protein